VVASPGPAYVRLLNSGLGLGVRSLPAGEERVVEKRELLMAIDILLPHTFGITFYEVNPG